MPAKLYCYVDETGQHTMGKLFIVCVVIAGPELENLLSICEAIEARTGKRGKWIKTAYELRTAYIQEVLNNPIFQNRLIFETFEQTTNYVEATTQAIAEAISIAVRESGEVDYKATVFIDGLTEFQERITARDLRKKGLRLRKLRGIRDESSPLIRLADSMCGFIAAALEGQPIMMVLFERAIRTGFLKNISEK